ncbi:MAG: hypothetical protein V4673_14610 [Pseudomonadota bacterium]
MAKKPVRELRVMANKAQGKIEIIHLADGLPVCSIEFNQEQAEAHARVLIDAIEMINGPKSSLILPDQPAFNN